MESKDWSLNGIMSTKSILLLTLSIDIIAIVMALLGVGLENRGTIFHRHYFITEGSFITWLSLVQLLAIAGLAWSIFELRKGKSPLLSSWKAPCMIWAIIAAGFLYLSIDEVAQIHERLDKLIHLIFNIEETNLTDRIDDVTVGCYGLLGIGTLYFYREEMKRYGRVLSLFIIGFVFMFTSVVLDILADRNDIFPIFIADPRVAKMFNLWSGAVEEMFKIFAEGIFIGTFYYCLEVTLIL